MSEAATATATPAAEAAGSPAATPATTAPSGGFMGGTPAAAATPAATPAHFFGEHVQNEGAFKEGWTENLRAAGYERLANKAAFAKDEASLLRTLDETIGFVGKKPAGISYPKEGAADEDVSAYRHDAGVPDSPDAYNLKPATLPDGVAWDDAGVKPYAEIFHKHHIPQAAAAALIEQHMNTVIGQVGAGQVAMEAKIGDFAKASEATYQKEWGDSYDARLESNRAFVASRFDAAEMADPVLQAALSHPKFVRVIDEARRALREAPLPGVGREVTTGSHSPRQQAMEIMKANPAWRNDPTTAQRVGDLYALDAQQAKRAKK